MHCSKPDRLKFEKIILRTGKLSSDELDQFYSELQSVTIDEMIGLWKLGYFFTYRKGNRLEKMIRYFPIKLYGKRFKSKNKVQAWIFSFFGIKFGFPFTTAILETVPYRNKESTSMIYNYLPMIDHFRKVDNSTVMGIMEVKGNLSLYFYLVK